MTRKPKAQAVAIGLPPMPPPTEKEIAAEQRLLALIREISELLLQRNLDNAVLLAQQAARRRGPLVDHFQELGRRYANLLKTPEKPRLQVIKGEPA